MEVEKSFPNPEGVDADLLESLRILATASTRALSDVAAQARMRGGDDVTSLLADILVARQSVDTLAPALVRLETSATPSAARAAQATENVWRVIASEFGLLSSVEVGRLLGTKTANRSFASDLRTNRGLLGVRRLNSFVYPGFQFDRLMGAVIPAIPAMLRLATEFGWSDEGVALWLMGPTTYLGGDRPVDYLDDAERLVGVARNAWGADW